MRKLTICDQAALLSALNQVVCRSQETAFLHRLHGLFLISLGFSCPQVARWFGKDPKTLERWVHAYLKLGAEGLRCCKKPGRRSYLDPAQREILKEDLTQTPRALGYRGERWSGRLLARHLKKRFDVVLSLRQCQRLIRRLCA